MRSIVLIVHNVRSCHNVGSLLRTADGLGIEKAYLTGYTPYPAMTDDLRLPHIAAKIHKQIQKTALGAENVLAWQQATDISALLHNLKSDGYQVAALEQTPHSMDITNWRCPNRLALLVGRETFGLEPEVLSMCDVALEIPMLGRKESFNVAQAAAMALYHCVFVK